MHHAAPFCRNHRITVGWLNAPLTWLGFFPALERRVTRFTGAVPREDDLGRDAAVRLAGAAATHGTAPARPAGA